MTGNVMEQNWKVEALAAIAHAGDKKKRILDFIIENRNQDTNFLIVTQYEMAKSCDTSQPTVGQTIQLLIKADLLKRKKGAFKIIFPGS